MVQTSKQYGHQNVLMCVELSGACHITEVRFTVRIHWLTVFAKNVGQFFPRVCYNRPVLVRRMTCIPQTTQRSYFFN